MPLCPLQRPRLRPLQRPRLRPLQRPRLRPLPLRRPQSLTGFCLGCPITLFAVMLISAAQGVILPHLAEECMQLVVALFPCTISYCTSLLPAVCVPCRQLARDDPPRSLLLPAQESSAFDSQPLSRAQGRVQTLLPFSHCSYSSTAPGGRRWIRPSTLPLALNPWSSRWCCLVAPWRAYGRDPTAVDAEQASPGSAQSGGCISLSCMVNDGSGYNNNDSSPPAPAQNRKRSRVIIYTHNCDIY